MTNLIIITAVLGIIWCALFCYAVRFIVRAIREMRRDAQLKKEVLRTVKDALHERAKEERLAAWQQRYEDESGVRPSDPPPPKSEAA